MTRLEKCKLAKEKGFTYNSNTGEIYGVNGKVVSRKANGYINCSFYYNKKIYQFYGHHFAWYFLYNEIVEFIDHKDLNRSNNKAVNLRKVTHQENTFNNKAKGYSKMKNSKYRSFIFLNGKQIHLGCFNDSKSAHNAYVEAKNKYHIISNK